MNISVRSLGKAFGHTSSRCFLHAFISLSGPSLEAVDMLLGIQCMAENTR